MARCSQQRYYPGGVEVDVAPTPGLQVSWGWLGESGLDRNYLLVKHQEDDEGPREERAHPLHDHPPGWTSPPSISIRVRPHEQAL